MNTKSALIIAVAIVIGFSIEPILDRVDFSDPGERLIKVVATDATDHMGYSYEFYVKVDDGNWLKEDGMWYCRTGGYQPADAYALKAILDYKED
jgi:hypothetical protein